MNDGKRQRLFELDWLRVIAILILLGFHTGMIFVSWDWHIKSPETSRLFEIVMGWLHYWRMPLLLFISGAGTYFALGFRSPGTFVAERHRRLLVPLLFGMLVIVPPQIYFEKIASFSSYLEFYPTVFELVPYPEGSLSWHHLWFILYLLLYSVLALPFFLLLRRPSGQRITDCIHRLVRTRAGFALALVPIALSQFVLRPFFPRETHALTDDWAFFVYYGSFFVLGFLCVRDARLWQLIRQRRRQHLVTAVAVLAPFYLTWFVPYSITFYRYDFIHSLPAMAVAWFWVLAAIGYGQVWLRKGSPLLTYANEAIYPFYILHQTVIICIGYYVIRWHGGIYLNFALICVLTLIVSMAIYHLLIRPFTVTRFLFGMKPLPARERASWAMLGKPGLVPARAGVRRSTEGKRQQR